MNFKEFFLWIFFRKKTLKGEELMDAVASETGDNFFAVDYLEPVLIEEGLSREQFVIVAYMWYKYKYIDDCPYYGKKWATMNDDEMIKSVKWVVKNSEKLGVSKDAVNVFKNLLG